jgi:hypothetical protein
MCTSQGAPLRFVPPDDEPLPYERRVFERGEVITRPDSWHDAYNALVWLEYPLSKATLNRRHVEAMAHELGAQRGRIRDRLTQFDECGIVITGLRESLWEALCAHRWREVFVEHRAELRAHVRFHIFGHASRDLLRAPFVGLCGKALWLEERFSEVDVDQTTLDCALNRRLTRADFSETLQQPWQPLPLLGIPGITPESESPTYYDDERQFRPARAHKRSREAASG